MSFLRKVLGDPNNREVSRHLRRVEDVNAPEAEMEARTDADLLAVTERLRRRIAEARADALAAREAADAEPTVEELSAAEKAVDQVLDEVLPEAFAAVREASRRQLGMRHFDVQMVGGVVLHQGNSAVM